MIPTGRLALLLAGGIVLALGMTVEHILDIHHSAFLLPLVAWNAIVALLALVDLAAGWRPRIDVRRHVPTVLSVARSNPVSVEVENRGRIAVHLEVNDDGAELIDVTGMPAAFRLARGDRATWKYHLVPAKRGAHRLGSVWVRVRSPGGLWKRQIRAPLDQDVAVYPDLQAVRLYEMLARDDREERFTHVLRRRGGESEFERLREYTRDDDARRIDWKATARRGQVIAREYQLERNQNIMFLLDLGRQMTAESEGLSYVDHALNALLMLSHVSVRAGDHVGLAAFDAGLRTWLAPQGGANAVRKIVRATYDLFPSLEEPDYGAVFSSLKFRLRKRSLLVFFTQVLDGPTRQKLVPLVRSLSPAHLPLCVVFRDESVEAMLHPGGTSPEEQHTQGAAAAEVLWRERLVEEMRQTGAIVLYVKPKELTQALVARYLDVKARQLL